MTRIEFQNKYYHELKTFIESPCGQHFLSALSSTRPPYEFNPQNHLFAENRGATRGFELCIRNILGLCMPPTVQHEAEPTYGVPNKVS